MPAPESIRQLVARFEEHREGYHASRYNEAQLRREFLDPFLEALGWDLFNKQSYAEAYKEVVHEDSLEVEGATKAPDYAFRVGGQRKFFVEAKKPAVNIQSDIHPAFQLRRYAWSAKLPLGVLSDFEEFAIYDCRSKPDKKDKATTGRVAYYSYREYVEKWDEIADIFSREAVLKGSFDKYAEGVKGKKGTTEVDDAFLTEIEHWRDVLARNFAIRNPSLTTRELNYAVQMTIDRIIFLRICEDRGIERYEKLKEVSTQENVYEGLCQVFQQADARYNSGLFHFSTGRTAKDEKEASSPADSLTLGLSVDDKVLREILGGLYYPESPYVFSEIPADILGQVYERFLGKVIRLTAGHQAKVEEKPEVRKAGGVYYTPTYIVEYIVKNTVGKLLDGKRPEGLLEKDSVASNQPSGRSMTPKEVSNLRILDPACGSGTFPLGAFQYLLDWHLKWYTDNDPEKWSKGKSPAIFQSDKGWMLTTAEKKRILLNNIYGVDIDPQAVEVTKLSLLLKVLENESEQTIGSQLALIQERALPDLGKNIKCGNSLIGPDYYNAPLRGEGHQLTMLVDEEERYRVNAFDWKAEFSQVFIQGGFDVVIGNPPYLRIQGLQENHENELDYFIARYNSAVKRFDLYLLFIEKSFSLLSHSGSLGFICPHKFVNSDFGSGLRQYLISNRALDTMISFGNNLIFDQASTYTGLLFLRKASSNEFKYCEFPNTAKQELIKELFSLTASSFTSYKLDDFSSKPWILTQQKAQTVLSKLTQPNKLEDVCESIFQGVVTGVDEIYFLQKQDNIGDGKTISVYSERLQKSINIEKEIIKPMLKGEDISRYSIPEFNYYCIYPYKLVSGKTVILEENEFSEKYPLAYEYLASFKNELRDFRVKFKTNPKYWYSCHRARSMKLFETARIITPEISLGCNLTITPAGLYHNTKVYSIIPNESRLENQYYWLGLLNSKVMWWFLSNTGYVLRGGYFVFKTNYLNPFPIRTINFSDSVDKARHDKMVSLVERMLELHKQSAVVRSPLDKERVGREIESTDKAIDKLVYELYGLTEGEVKVVEGR